MIRFQRAKAMPLACRKDDAMPLKDAMPLRQGLLMWQVMCRQPSQKAICAVNSMHR